MTSSWPRERLRRLADDGADPVWSRSADDQHRGGRPRRARHLGRVRTLTLGLAWTLAASTLLALPACAFQGDESSSGVVALREGRYDDAIAAFSRRTRQQPSAVDAWRGLVQALMAVGRYEDAEQAARSGAAGAGAVELANTLGEALYAQGEVADAETAFRAAIAGSSSDRLEAQVNLGILLERRGARAEARAIFDAFIDVYNRGEATTARALAAVGTAVRHLGGRDPQLFKDAVRAYEEAIAADPARHEARLLLADLFLDKYNSTESQAVYGEVLRVNPSHPRALTGLARARRFDGEGGEALELVRRALDVNPNLVAGRVLLAELHVEAGEYDAAVAAAEQALNVNPASLEALAALAAVRYLQGDTAGYESVRQRALALDPFADAVYIQVAELAARQRRYAAAARLAAQAVALDSASWRAWAVLGLNQLRIGRIGEGRASLETSFAGDPYNVWVKNTLDLLDTFSEYESRSSPRFEFFLHRDEADLLFPYMATLAEQAYDRLSQRYDYRPDGPIRVEVYPRHADFSVRTLGLVGLGALGVSFGDLLVMDSPAARDSAAFNWGSTLWHEIAHAFTLGMTDHRVPRWLTEGLSVLEERRARPGWGADVMVGFLAAFEQGRLLPIQRLDDGFVRPSYPGQVEVSYYQASLVAEMIENQHGFDAIRAMLEGYRAGRGTGEIIQQVLDATPEAFDEAFDRWLRTRFATALAAIDSPRPGPAGFVDAAVEDTAGARWQGRPARAEAVRRADAQPDDFAAQLAAGRALFDAGELEAARPYLERARSLFPAYAGPHNPYRYLAEIYERGGATRAAAEALASLVALDETDYQAHLDLARLRESMGNIAGAAAALERAVYIDPYDVELHTQLAELFARAADWEKAIRERRAIVALEPVDRAGAVYRLALAYYNAGDRAAARREVLRALEAAPGFAAAQELLLRLHEGTDGKDGS